MYDNLYVVRLIPTMPQNTEEVKIEDLPLKRT